MSDEARSGVTAHEPLNQLMASTSAQGGGLFIWVTSEGDENVILLAVAAGGALGAASRYLLAVRLYSLLGIDFPWGTLSVNLVGSLFLGLLTGLIEERGVFTPEVRSFMTIGFLGGMTTFSTFIYEDWQFARDGEILKAGTYAASSVLAGFLLFWLGHVTAGLVVRE